MKLKSETEIEISRFYGDKHNNDLMATVSMLANQDYYVDFYKDEVIVDSRRLAHVSLRYAEDLAENYVLGIIKLNSKTKKVDGV